MFTCFAQAASVLSQIETANKKKQGIQVTLLFLKNITEAFTNYGMLISIWTCFAWITVDRGGTRKLQVEDHRSIRARRKLLLLHSKALG